MVAATISVIITAIPPWLTEGVFALNGMQTPRSHHGDRSAAEFERIKPVLDTLECMPTDVVHAQVIHVCMGL